MDKLDIITNEIKDFITSNSHSDSADYKEGFFDCAKLICDIMEREKERRS